MNKSENQQSSFEALREKVRKATQHYAKSNSCKYMPRLNFNECLAFCDNEPKKIKKVAQLVNRYGNRIPVRKFIRKMGFAGVKMHFTPTPGKGVTHMICF